MSKREPPDPLVDEIRATRARIWREHGNDIKRVIEHYMDLQREYTGPRISAPPSAPGKRGKSAA